MNFHNIINPIINTLVPNRKIKICFPTTTQDSDYNMTSTYVEVDTIAQVQFANSQKMEHADYYQKNRIYKRFYINTNSITGLNRNLSTTTDFIRMDNLLYKIVEFKYNFLTNWAHVIGCETTDFISG